MSARRELVKRASLAFHEKESCDRCHNRLWITPAKINNPNRISIPFGSHVAFPFFALFVPVLMYRLVHDERTLRRSLPGYAEYCERQRFRLVPWVW